MAKLKRNYQNQLKIKIVELFSAITENYLKSITSDRRKEFSKHPDLTKKLNQVPFYFPDSHAPWQRGTNENENGLLREYISRSQEMDIISDEVIQSYVEKLNLRPRKCLNWQIPYEVFYNITLHLI